MGTNALCVLFLGIICTVAVHCSPALVDRHAEESTARPLLGRKEKACTWGPSYWCQNITTAKGCNAVRHCIQTVWEHTVLPEDNDDVCTICKKMVQQARDQLESNETQEELKEVFEGSCNLIPLKPVAQGCDKLVDEFIPELVETLSSQMNPQVVCSVAGLCNNAEIDRMLVAASAQGKVVKVPLSKAESGVSVPKSSSSKMSDCEVCSSMFQKLQRKIKGSDRDALLNKMLEACGYMGSFSDGCAAAVLTNYPDIHDALEKTLFTSESCELMQYCNAGEPRKTHVDVDIVPVGEVGVVPILGDDTTCQFCERMVIHLRDILVANTTEAEFKQVLVGLCKQSRKFKDECLGLVDEYYGMLYNFLVNNLNGQELCSFAGLCPGPGLTQVPIMPLIPGDIDAGPLVGQDEAHSYKNPVVEISVSSNSAKVNVEDPASMQLPIERMMIPHMLVNVGSNKAICEFCEYFLHYVQTTLADEKTEEKVKAVIEGACEHLPSSINNQCKDFVDSYGNAFIAILVQEIDPSFVCPGMGFCPSQGGSLIVLVGRDDQNDEKPGCPLCLLAVEQLETLVKDNKTEESVKSALESLCAHLPKSLVGECDNFVDVYSEQLVDMLIADFTPQEVCVYIKLCSTNKTASSNDIIVGDVFTNEIPQYENEKLQKGLKGDQVCVICEFAMARIDAMLKNNATESEIKSVVHSVCNHLPKTVVPQCNKFVDEYADLVITLLAQEMDPKKICTELHLCDSHSQYSDRVALSVLQQHTMKNVEECALCEGIVQALDTYLRDPNVEEKIDDLLERVCQVLPAKQYSKCRDFIKVYGPSIQNIIAQIPGASHLICGKIGVCLKGTGSVDLLGGRKCTWGPGYWCQKEEHARACGPGTLQHCQEFVWKGERP